MTFPTVAARKPDGTIWTAPVYPWPPTSWTRQATADEVAQLKRQEWLFANPTHPDAVAVVRVKQAWQQLELFEEVTGD